VSTSVNRRLVLSVAVIVTALLTMPDAALAAHHHGHHKHKRHHHKAWHRPKPTRHELTRGVVLRRFYDRRTRSLVHLAIVKPGAPVRFRAVPASMPIAANDLDRTSSMCKAVHCLLAVNGSFRDIPSRQARGGEIVRGAPVRLRGNEPQQAIFSAHRPVHVGALRTDIRIRLGDHRGLRIRGVNVDPGKRGLTLFTSQYGRRTPKGLTLRVDIGHRFRLGRIYDVHLGTLAPGPRRIGQGSLVLVARGDHRAKLRDLARRAQGEHVTLTSTTPMPVPQSIGASFRLLRHGKVVVPHLHWRLVNGRAPRTVLAWRRNGAVLLIVVDGRRRHSAGVTLRQAAGLARRLGARNAVNLDGGGSSTFVVRGHVRNVPSDGRERGVVNALALVRSGEIFDPTYDARMRAAARREAEEKARRKAAAERRRRQLLERVGTVRAASAVHGSVVRPELRAPDNAPAGHRPVVSAGAVAAVALTGLAGGLAIVRRRPRGAHRR